MSPPVSVDLDDFFQRDRLGNYLVVRLISLTPDCAKVRMEVEEQHLNQFGTVHGGVIFSLADIAFGLAGNAAGIPAVAIDASISYMKSVQAGTLYAEARMVSTQGQLATYRVIVSDQQGDKIALFQGMAYKKTALSFPSPE